MSINYQRTVNYTKPRLLLSHQKNRRLLLGREILITPAEFRIQHYKCWRRKSPQYILKHAYISYKRSFRPLGLPALNFAYHCETSVSSEYPFLLRCPKIEEGILECQKRGKKVLMSIGGATGDGTLPSAYKARELARTLSDLFLAVGNRYQDLRPFGRYLQFIWTRQRRAEIVLGISQRIAVSRKLACWNPFREIRVREAFALLYCVLGQNTLISQPFPWANCNDG